MIIHNLNKSYLLCADTVFITRSYSQYSLQSIISPGSCFGGQICGIQPTGNKLFKVSSKLITYLCALFSVGYQLCHKANCLHFRRQCLRSISSFAFRLWIALLRKGLWFDFLRTSCYRKSCFGHFCQRHRIIFGYLFTLKKYNGIGLIEWSTYLFP